MALIIYRSALQRWQLRTGLSLFVGYSAYYLCRSNLAIVAPLLIREFGGRGLNKEVLGQLASVGVLFYAAGKVVNGVLGDLLGGKKIFVLGMVGAVAATLLFGISRSIPLFFGAWAVNRFVQSMGWAGLVKTTAHWFSYRAYGKVMGLLSLSYLVGDIVAKLVLGQLLVLGLGWRAVFGVAAAALGAVAVLNWFSLQARPEKVGLASPAVSPTSLFAATGPAAAPVTLGALLRPYFQSPAFRLMLAMSFGMTALRETLSFWVPTYLVEVAHLPEGVASQYSALYSVFGMASILGAGYLSDGWLRGQRGLLLLAGSGVLVPVLLLMARPAGVGSGLPLLLIALTGLLLLGPYSFLAGAMSLDAGGRQGAATAAGLVDAVGYGGGTGALWLTGRLAEHQGWGAALLALALLAAATAGAAFVFYRTQEHRPARVPAVA